MVWIIIFPLNLSGYWVMGGALGFGRIGGLKAENFLRLYSVSRFQYAYVNKFLKI